MLSKCNHWNEKNPEKSVCLEKKKPNNSLSEIRIQGLDSQQMMKTSDIRNAQEYVYVVKATANQRAEIMGCPRIFFSVLV